MQADIRAEYIIAEYKLATDTQRAAGRAWYVSAGAIVNTLAEWSGADNATVAAVVASLSPRNPWRWNIADAAAILHHAKNGGPLPRVTTFNDNRDKAIEFVTQRCDWKTSALKVRSFVRNMTGDVHAVTVDVWAIRVATNGASSIVANDDEYRAATEAYRAAAIVLGETPRDLQAIVWIVAQTRGLGSRRIGRHDNTCKRGTLPIVCELFGSPVQGTLFN